MPNNNDYIRLVVNEPSSAYSNMTQMSQPTKTNLGEIQTAAKPTNNIQVTQEPTVTPKPTAPAQATVQPVHQQAPAPGSDWKSMGMGLLGIAAIIALLYLPTRRR